MELDVEDVVAFVLSRESAKGGFSFARTTPPTLDDTYYALRTLERLGHAYAAPKTREYVVGFQVSPFIPPKNIYQLAYLCRFLRLDHHGSLAGLIASRLLSPDSCLNLKGLYFLVSSLPYLHLAPDVHLPSLRSQVLRLAASARRMMDHVLRQLALMCQLGIPFDEEAYAEWIGRAQNGDGGFGFYPGTTSFLENTYYALRALSLLRSSPPDLQACRAFVQNCRASNGGFGRQSVSVPRLDSTYYAVSSLLILGEMERRQAASGRFAQPTDPVYTY